VRQALFFAEIAPALVRQTFPLAVFAAASCSANYRGQFLAMH
jgi:hypothetical protein